MISRSNYSIGSRGKIQPDDFPSYVKGSRDVLHFIYESHFSMEQASRLAPKVLYMAACLLTGHSFTKITDGGPYLKEEIRNEDLKALKVIRKIDPIGYGYLIRSDQLLRQMDL